MQQELMIAVGKWGQGDHGNAFPDVDNGLRDCPVRHDGLCCRDTGHPCCRCQTYVTVVTKTKNYFYNKQGGTAAIDYDTCYIDPYSYISLLKSV